MNVIVMYNPPTMQLCHYLGVLKNILKSMHINYLTFLLGDLNDDMLVENLRSTIFERFHD